MAENLTGAMSSAEIVRKNQLNAFLDKLNKALKHESQYTEKILTDLMRDSGEEGEVGDIAKGQILGLCRIYYEATHRMTLLGFPVKKPLHTVIFHDYPDEMVLLWKNVYQPVILALEGGTGYVFGGRP
jgi:hypothetical protein